MSERDDIRMALHDAIGWQLGLVDAWSEGSPDRAEALAIVTRYKAILKRRYGSSVTALDDMLSKAKPVTLAEIRAARNEQIRPEGK